MNLSDIAKLIEQNTNGQEVTQADVIKAMRSYLRENDSDAWTGATMSINVYDVLAYADEVEFSREEAVRIINTIDISDHHKEKAGQRLADVVDSLIDNLDKQDGRYRGSYTEEEIIPLTYAVLFGDEDLGGISVIVSKLGRSEGSIAYKMRQIASILDDPKFDIGDRGILNDKINSIMESSKDDRNFDVDNPEVLNDQINSIMESSKEEMLEQALDALFPDRND